RHRLAVPGAIAVGARGPVDGILQHPGDRVVVLGGAQQDGAGGADAALELDHLLRRAFLLVLVEARDAGDVEDLELRPRRHQALRGAQRALVEGLLAQASRYAENRDLISPYFLQSEIDDGTSP